jgi:hypothetical protein
VRQLPGSFVLLSGLTSLNLSSNPKLGELPQGLALPQLRRAELNGCCFR